MATTKRPVRKSSFNLPLNLDRRHYNSILAGLIGLFVIVIGYVAAQAFASATAVPATSTAPTGPTTTLTE